MGFFAENSFDKQQAGYQSSPVQTPQDSPGFWDYLSDIPMGVLRGGVSFGESLVELADSGVELFGGDLFEGNDLTWSEDILGENKTWVGDVTQGISQFAFGFVPVAGLLGRAGKAGKALKGLRDSDRFIDSLAYGSIVGAPTDFLAFNGHEGRLSDLIQQFPALQNPISEALASDPDDSEWEGRFKNAIEGLIVGGPAEMLFSGLRFLMGAKNAEAKGGVKGREDWIAKNQEKYAEELSKIEDPITAADYRRQLEEADLEPEAVDAEMALLQARSDARGVDIDSFIGVNVRRLQRGGDLDPEGLNQSVPIRIGSEELGIDGKANLENIQAALQRQAQAKLGRRLDMNNPEDLDLMVEQMYDEVKFEMENAGVDSGQSWYGEDMRKAWSEVTAMEPRLLEDDNYKGLFKTLLGITSQQNDVGFNAEMALRSFRGWLNSGKKSFLAWTEKGAIPGRSGWTIIQQYKGLEELIDRWGLEETVRWMNTEHPTRDIQSVKQSLSAYVDDAKVDAPIESTRMGSVLFGPKVGEFTQNVQGNTVRGTFDVWWSRTVRRLEGNLDHIKHVDKVTKKGKKVRTEVGATPKNLQDRSNMQKLAERVASRLGVEVADLQAIAWFYEKRLYNSVGYNVDVESFYDAFKRLRSEEEGPAFNRVREDAGSGATGRGADEVSSTGTPEAGGGVRRDLSGDGGRRAVASEILQVSAGNPNGYTFDPRTGRTLELKDIPDGYAVALHGHELRIPLDAGPEQYEQYLKELQTRLGDTNLFIGGWRDRMLDGSEADANVLDLTTVFRGSKEDALRFAREHGQEEIWDGKKTIRAFDSNKDKNTKQALRIREAIASEHLTPSPHQADQAIPDNAYRNLSESLDQTGADGEVKGQISFEPDGRALIKVFENSDVSTVVHETGHLFRRELERFDTELHDQAKQVFGVGEEGWTRAKEEEFAESFEAYLKEGKAPNPTLQKVFDSFKDWLTKIYQGITGTKAVDRISPEVRDFFDEMLGGRTAAQRNIDVPDKVKAAIAEQLSAVTRGEVELDEAIEGIDLNLDKLMVDVEAKELLNIVSRELESQTKAMTGGVESLTTTAQKALKTMDEDLSADGGLIDRLRTKQADAKDVIAAKMVLSGLSSKIVSLGRKMDLGNATKRETLQLIRHIEELAHLQVDLKANITEAARITSAGRIPIEVTASPDKLDELLSRAGGSKRVKDVVKQLKMTGASNRNVMNVVRTRWNTKARKFVNVHNEVWLNSILSGPVTHTVNIISTLTHGVARSLEKGVGGVAMGDLTSAREGLDELGGLFFAMKDSLKFAARSFKSGDTTLDVGHNTIDMAGNPARGEISGRGSKSPMGRMLDLVGNTVRLPSRFLTAEDELNKQLFYRSHLYAKGLADARRLGIPSGAKRKKHVLEYINSRIDEGGRALDETALYHAQEGTFTNDLGYGFGKTLQGLVNKHPVARLALPFVRTPTNIFRQLWRHTPGLAAFQEQWAADFKGLNGPERKAMAVGQQVMGSTLIFGAVAAAASGRITGGGPSDPRERALLMQTGWQPYSIVTTGEDGNKKYTSYQRLDPFASAIGLVADYAELGNRVSDEEKNEMAVGLMVAFAKNITNKTYLRGLSEAVDVLTDPDRNVERWAQRQAGSYVPNLFNQLNPDDSLREVRTVMDAIKSRTPGFSPMLDPRRNVFGQPITFEGALGPDMVSPFYQSTGLNSAARDELVDLGIAMGQPKEKQEGIDLTQLRVAPNQTSYDRWLELVGQVKIQNKGLEQYLNDLVKSEAYQRLPAQSTLPAGVDSSRVKLVKRAVEMYRNRALMQMFQENPEIKEMYQNAMVSNRRMSVLGAAAAQ